MSVDIAGGKGGSGGDYQGRRGDFGGEDRTTGDWRRDGGGDDNDGRGSPQGRDNRDSYGGGSDRRYGILPAKYYFLCTKNKEIKRCSLCDRTSGRPLLNARCCTRFVCYLQIW